MVTECLRCPRCGTVQAAHTAPLDLCPTCLLTAALSMDDDPCPYQVLAPMGEDAHGVTYLAQALTGTRRYAALKIYGPREDADMVLARYQRWKPILAGIEHPAVGTLLDVGLTAEGRLFVASEYVAGRPLTAPSARASIGVDQRTEIARQLSDAVGAAHAAGVVHLKLDASKVKLSTANGLHATILGFGSSLIVDGADGPPEVDQLALERILRDLGLEQ